MEITISAIEARIEELSRQRVKALTTAEACNGAIQDCQYWLSQIESEEKPSNVTELRSASE